MQTEREQTQAQQGWGWDVPVHSHPTWASGAEATTLPCLTVCPPREGVACSPKFAVRSQEGTGDYLCLRGNVSLTPGPGNWGQKWGEI